jgi:hypothetical protein
VDLIFEIAVYLDEVGGEVEEFLRELEQIAKGYEKDRQT